jgi:hypothetical protein
MREYMELGHAELVTSKDVEKPESQVFYLPMHAVYKSSSTTTKIRAVFDASAKSASGVSLNDILLVGPTVHPLLVNVLFRRHRIAVTADINKMYRAVELSPRPPSFCLEVKFLRGVERLPDDTCHLWSVGLIFRF